MKTALINPYDQNSLSEMSEAAHGLAYIAAVLRTKGHELKVIDGKVSKMMPEAIVQDVFSFHPEMIGITAMTPDIICAGKIAKLIRSYSPNLPIVIGGAHVTALPIQTLEEFPEFDFGVVGEGEQTILELTQSLEVHSRGDAYSKIKGIVFKDTQGRVSLSPPRAWIDNLDDLPFPAWELFPVSPKGIREFPVFATRGCPFRCRFCMRLMGNRVRKRSPENVIAEIFRIKALSTTGFFWFSDETFGVDKIWLNHLLDLLIEHKVQLKMKWSANSHVSLANKELYLKIKEAGCIELFFGIESGNDLILEDVAKGINTHQAKKAVKIAKDAGLEVGAFFLIGHPNETKKTIIDTIRFAASLDCDRIVFGKMVAYPGTEIRRMAEAHEGGYNYLSHNWNDYVKYGKNALGVKGLSPVQITFFQIFAYLYFYIRNLRLKDLARFLCAHKATFKTFIRSKFISIFR
jgi:radical SAM superfamily enzyme YgiQ (UPF0313 family)